MQVNNVEIKEYKGIRGHGKIRHEWQAILDTMPHYNFFHTWEWYYSYLHNLDKSPDKTEFHVVFLEKKPIAIFALKRQREKYFFFTLNMLEAPSHSHMDLATFAVTNYSQTGLYHLFIDHLNQHTTTKWDALRVGKILGADNIYQEIKANKTTSIIKVKHTNSSYMKCDADTNHLNINLPKKFHRNIRRLKKRALTIGKVIYFYEKERDRLNDAFEIFLKLEASGWKGQTGTGSAIILNDQVKNFYFSLIDQFSKDSRCQINLIKIGESYAAGQFCLIANGVLSILKIGFNEKFKDIAPSNLLLFDLLQKCQLDPEINTVSLTTGPLWAKRWHPENLDVYNLFMFNKTIKGIILYFLLFCKERLKKEIQKKSNR